MLLPMASASDPKRARTVMSLLLVALAGCDDEVKATGSGTTGTTGATSTSSSSSSSSGTGGGTAVLPIDCCDPAHKVSDVCFSADPGPGTIGAGPPVTGFLSQVQSGFVEAGKAIVAVKNTGPVGGMVMSVDLATGSREVLTGTYQDPMMGAVDKGGGDLVNPDDVARGPDGFYLLALSGGDVYRADFTSGDRSLAFASSDCVASGSTIARSSAMGLEADETGALYQGALQPGGIGVVKLFENACSVVSFTNPKIGSGPDFLTYTGISYGNGKLFGTWYTDESLLSVDTTTGDRLRLSATVAPTVGSGPPFGTASSRLGSDAHVWVGADAVGGVALVTRVNVDVMDPNVGDREPFDAECGPLTTFDNENVFLYGEYGSFWVIGKDSAVYLFDPVTKNSNRVSR